MTGNQTGDPARGDNPDSAPPRSHPFRAAVFLCLAVTGSLLPAHAAPPAPVVPTKPGVEISDVVVGTGGARNLHARVARPTAPPPGRMPGILYVHGGGWSKGDYLTGGATWLVAHGYVVMSVEYRLTGEAPWPAQIEDCKLAVRWLRANADRYQVDPTRIGCWGSSAGGHLAACLGTMSDQKQFEGPGGCPGVSSEVQAVVDFYGPTDMTAGSAGIAGATKESAAIITALFGGSFEEKPDQWREGSPITYVRPGQPPFLLVHGSDDRAVPVDQSIRFASALAKAQIPVKLIVVKNAGHGLKPSPGGLPPEPDRTTVNAEVLAFLDAQLKRNP